jgi:LexA-binding, inner membrane-associated putative hydrolase
VIGRSHLTVGACALAAVGAALATLAPWSAPKFAAIAALLVLYGNLAPDHDHRYSTVTRAWGPLTQAYSAAWIGLSWLVYHSTKTERDAPNPSMHRTLTHTYPGAALVGVATVAPLALNPIVAAVGLGLIAGATGYAWRRRWLLPAAALGAALGLAGYETIATGWPALAIALALGCCLHLAADCTTYMGCATRFPVTDRETGRRWQRHGTPTWLRYAAGSDQELVVVRCLVAATALVVWWFVLA